MRAVVRAGLLCSSLWWGCQGEDIPAGTNAHTAHEGEERASVSGASLGGRWTAWLSRDSPTGTGDWETLADFLLAGKACPSPIDIQCQTVAGVDWRSAGQRYSCVPMAGGICQNALQPEGGCLDYRVRFLCP